MQGQNLLTASSMGQCDEIVRLLDAGGNLEERSDNQSTPLLLAAKGGRLDAVKLLLKRGASVNVADEPGLWSPLLYAANYGHDEVCKELLAHGANANHANKFGNTPLHAAAIGTRASHVECVKLLLAAGADKNALYDGRVVLDAVLAKNGTNTFRDQIKELLK